ncbi:MAG: hypothetical protein N2C14_10585 [Planctomycetales bacterium]
MKGKRSGSLTKDARDAAMENPYQSPKTQPRVKTNGAWLASSRWLCRTVLLEDGGASITYNAWGPGYESVCVESGMEKIVVREGGLRNWWFVPRFDFDVPVSGRVLRGRLEVRVWPWLAMRIFHLYVEDQLVYAEGS